MFNKSHIKTVEGEDFKRKIDEANRKRLGEKFSKLSEVDIKFLSKEYSQSFFRYNNYALTENSIIDERSYSYLKYKDILWIYETDTKQYALFSNDLASYFMGDFTRGLVHILMGNPMAAGGTKMTSILGIHGPKKKTIILYDHKTDIYAFRTTAKPSKDFTIIRDYIADKLKSDVITGLSEENLASYYDAIGEKYTIIEPQKQSYEADFFEGDDDPDVV